MLSRQTGSKVHAVYAETSGVLAKEMEFEISWALWNMNLPSLFPTQTPKTSHQILQSDSDRKHAQPTLGFSRFGWDQKKTSNIPTIGPTTFAPLHRDARRAFPSQITRSCSGFLRPDSCFSEQMCVEILPFYWFGLIGETWEGFSTLSSDEARGMIRAVFLPYTPSD